MARKKQSPFSIFILDDVPSTRRMVKLILETKLECTATVCADGNALFECLREHTPDLFLLDIQMPGISGLDVAKRLKGDKATEHVPIVFFSAHGTPQIRVDALKAGGADYLDKPFYPDELIARVSMHIHAYQQNQRIQKSLEEQGALLRVLCHDLQNPLAAIYAIVNFYQTAEEVNVDEIMPMIMDATESGLAIIKHVREYRQLTDDATSFSIQEVFIQEAIHEVLVTMRPIAEAKEIALDVNLEKAFKVRLNRVMLVHNILGNLVTNAIKFSRRGSAITITARGINLSGVPHCEIEVRDEGIGIPGDILRNLFNPAQNISRQGTEGETGNGFGMPLVHHYVDRCEGEIHVHSIPEEEDVSKSGTAVAVSFPLID